MRKFAILFAVLIVLLNAACNPRTSEMAPAEDTPEGTTQVNPNQLQAGKNFYSFNIDQRTNYTTEGRIYIHAIKPENGNTGAWITIYSNTVKAYSPFGSIMISATESDVMIAPANDTSTSITIPYNTDNEAHFRVTVSATPSSSAMTITVCDVSSTTPNNSFTVSGTLPDNSSVMNMGLQTLTDVTLTKLEAFTTGTSTKPNNSTN